MGSVAGGVGAAEAVPCCVARERDDPCMPPAYSMEAYRQSHAPDFGLDTGLCVVCLSRPADSMCLPCGHLMICQGCAHILEQDCFARSRSSPPLRCPCCRQAVFEFKQVLVQRPCRL